MKKRAVSIETARFALSVSESLQHGILEHPEAVGEVDLVAMGVEQTLVLIPEGGEVFLAVLLDFAEKGHFHRDEKFPDWALSAAEMIVNELETLA